MQNGNEMVELSICISDITEALSSTHYVIEDSDEAILEFIKEQAPRIDLQVVSANAVTVPRKDMDGLIQHCRDNPKETSRFLKDFIYGLIKVILP